MTREDAEKLVGRQPHVALKNMALALTLGAWQNTPEDWKRLEASVIVLGAAAPKRARQFLKRHKEGGAM